MKLEADTRIAYPRDRVWSVYVDEMELLAEHLPNIKSIERKSREEKDGVVHVLRLWTAKGDIPKAAQGVLKPHLLQWLDFAQWDPKAFRCEWRIESCAFPDALESRGTTTYEEAPGGTLVSLRGEVDIHTDRVRGVPRFLAGTIRPIVERMVIAAITPNMTGVAKGVEKYLNAKG